MSGEESQPDQLQNFARKSARRLDDLSRKPYVQGLPEWNMFPDEASRRAAIKEIESRMMPRSLTQLVGFLALVFVLFFTPLIVAHLLMSYLVPPIGPWNSRLAWGLAIVGYTILVFLGLRRNMPKELRAHLIKAGVPICLKCGYDLRGLPGDRTQCPECGREFDETVAELVRLSREQPNS